MTQRRGTTTDQLANLIQVIQLGRKSGTLTVERGEGASLEEGTILFVQGQITEAHVGRRNNQVALNWFKTWKACRFTFVADDAVRQTGPVPAMPGGTRQPSGETPPYIQTSPRMPVTPQTPNTSTQVGKGTGPLPDTSPMPRRLLPAEEALRLLELGGLSRVHRHLLLLIDGRRTTQELVRLMGRRPDEVQKLLHDLEYIRVVQS